MITIKVTVTNGVPPVPIKVHIDNMANANDVFYKSKLGFQQDFNIVPGKYIITIFGVSPKDGTTEVTLSGKIKNGPFPATPLKATDQIYSLSFYVEI